MGWCRDKARRANEASEEDVVVAEKAARKEAGMGEVCVWCKSHVGPAAEALYRIGGQHCGCYDYNGNRLIIPNPPMPGRVSSADGGARQALRRHDQHV